MEAPPSPLENGRRRDRVVRRIVCSVYFDGGGAVSDGGRHDQIDDLGLPAATEAPAGLRGTLELRIFCAVFPNFFWTVGKMATERTEFQTAARPYPAWPGAGSAVLLLRLSGNGVCCILASPSRATPPIPARFSGGLTESRECWKMAADAGEEKPRNGKKSLQWRRRKSIISMFVRGTCTWGTCIFSALQLFYTSGYSADGAAQGAV